MKTRLNLFLNGFRTGLCVCARVCVCSPAHLTPWAMSPHIKLAQYSHQCGPLNVCTYRIERDKAGMLTHHKQCTHHTCTQLPCSFRWHTHLQQQNYLWSGYEGCYSHVKSDGLFNPLRQLISRSEHRGTEDVYTRKRKEQKGSRQNKRKRGRERVCHWTMEERLSEAESRAITALVPLCTR